MRVIVFFRRDFFRACVDARSFEFSRSCTKNSTRGIASVYSEKNNVARARRPLFQPRKHVNPGKQTFPTARCSASPCSATRAKQLHFMFHITPVKCSIIHSYAFNPTFLQRILRWHYQCLATFQSLDTLMQNCSISNSRIGNPISQLQWCLKTSFVARKKLYKARA